VIRPTSATPTATANLVQIHPRVGFSANAWNITNLKNIFIRLHHYYGEDYCFCQYYGALHKRHGTVAERYRAIWKRCGALRKRYETLQNVMEPLWNIATVSRSRTSSTWYCEYEFVTFSGVVWIMRLLALFETQKVARHRYDTVLINLRQFKIFRNYRYSYDALINV